MATRQEYDTQSIYSCSTDTTTLCIRCKTLQTTVNILSETFSVVQDAYEKLAKDTFKMLTTKHEMKEIRSGKERLRNSETHFRNMAVVMTKCLGILRQSLKKHRKIIEKVVDEHDKLNENVQLYSPSSFSTSATMYLLNEEETIAEQDSFDKPEDLYHQERPQSHVISADMVRANQTTVEIKTPYDEVKGENHNTQDHAFKYNRYLEHKKVRDSRSNQSCLQGSRQVFTKNPADLKGEIVSTSIVKSIRGFGLYIIGGGEEQFLQIGKIVDNSPAQRNDKLHEGDVLVYIDGECVLGFCRDDVVNLLQSKNPLQKVNLSVCRLFPLPSENESTNFMPLHISYAMACRQV